MRALAIRTCGPGTSLQDRGRFGWQRFGVASSGAMDPAALACANVLVGNAPGEGAIEFMLLGGSVEAEGGPVRLAYAGPPAALALDGEPVAPFASLALAPGQVLTVGPLQGGVYGYLAAGGGFDVPPQLGSVSLHRRAGLGGYRGRAFRAGDRVPLRPDPAPEAPRLALPPLAGEDAGPLRVVLGPQQGHFSEAGLATLLSASYVVSAEADRMGYRLSGPRIEHAHGFNIVSDGIVAGSVQVPGGGEPIVMMADRQTTGGYPKIATVVSADLRRLAQRRPGEGVRFAAIAVEEALALARERAAFLAGLADAARPLGALPSVDRLLGLNLAGAAVDALGGET